MTKKLELLIFKIRSALLYHINLLHFAGASAADSTFASKFKSRVAQLSLTFQESRQAVEECLEKLGQAKTQRQQQSEGLERVKTFIQTMTKQGKQQ